MTFRPPKKPALTLDASLVQDDLPLEVIPKVFIGSIHSAFSAESLHHNGITHILNASRLPNTFPKQFTYLSVEIRDRDSSNILACIPTTNIFIEAGLEHGGVLVHCFGGKSRSAAFVCAYIMSSLGWSFDEAYSTVRAARPIVEINAGFECQLRAYHAASCDVYIAQQLLLRTRIRALHRTRQLNIQHMHNMLAGGAGIAANSGGMKDSPGDRRPSPLTITNSASTSNAINTNMYRETIEHSTSIDSMDVDEPHHSSTNTTHPSTHPTTSTTTSAALPRHLKDSHKYDSFTFGSATGISKSDDSVGMGSMSGMNKHGALHTLHIPKLAAQSEDDEFTFSKTRSISDVYTSGMDPCLEDDTQHTNTTTNATTYTDHDSDDPHTLRLLQQKHYIADSPSNTTHSTMHSANNTSMAGLSGFSQLSTGGSNNAGFRGLGLNLSISTNTNTSTSSTTSGLGMGGGLGLGLSLNTNTTTTTTAPSINTNTNNTFTTTPLDYSHGLTSTANSSSANFMQGSGSASGNRTHRASAQANRHKTGAAASGTGGGGRGRKSRSSGADDAPPACRLSRPGSTAVRVIPPLRGLERQFLCSWCNTSLFTTANVLRTDLDLRVLLDLFVSSSGAALAAASTNATGSSGGGQGRFVNERQGGEEPHLLLLAQEKERSRLMNDNNNNNYNSGGGDSNSNSLSSSPYTLYDQPDAKSSAVSPAMRLSSLPAINPGSNASSPASRLGEAKTSLGNMSIYTNNTNNGGTGGAGGAGGYGSGSETSPRKGEMTGMDVSKKESSHNHNHSSSSGRLPVITLNRSAQGSASNLLLNVNNANNTTTHTSTSNNSTPNGNPRILSRQSSGRDFGLNAVNGNSNNNSGGGGGMEMDVDSFSPSKQGYDQEDRHGQELSTQPRAPPGGPRTSRAVQSRAFDFDLPIIDTSSTSGGMSGSGSGVSPVKDSVASMGAIAEYTYSNTNTPTTHNHNIFSEGSKKAYHQDDINLGALSAEDNELSVKNSNSRRGSGGGLPQLLHSKTTISNSSIKSDSNNSYGTSSGTNPGNPHNHPVVMSNSTPTISSTDLYNTTTNTTNTSSNNNTMDVTPTTPTHNNTNTTSALPHRMANLKVSLGIAALNTTEGAQYAHPAGPTEVHYTDHKHSSPSALNTARSEESPRIHIPPHRMQQYQNSISGNTSTSNANYHTTYNTNTSTNNTNNTIITTDSPRSYTHLSHAQQAQLQFSRPQSAEKRRWLERMNLLRNSSSQALLLAQHHTSASSEYVGSVVLGQSGDHKVARMAEADIAASQIIYSNNEKYFHIEYLEWMGPAPLCGVDKGTPEKNSTTSTSSGGTGGGTNTSGGVCDSGDVCCPSCKNVVGGWSWVPSVKATLGGKLEAPLFKIHKHVVHQMDVQFDATPSSTPRISTQQMHTD